MDDILLGTVALEGSKAVDRTPTRQEIIELYESVYGETPTNDLVDKFEQQTKAMFDSQTQDT